MRSRIKLLETANRQANGHIAELSDQLAAAYAEIDRLKGGTLPNLIADMTKFGCSSMECPNEG